MSTTTNKDGDNIPQNRYSFQYFNKEFDFGVENEEGECVRKRKKPGRKSNPPSQQEKRAKNRLAQKVFREREQQRKEEKERQQQLYDLKIQELKSKLAIAQFESRYLKGCVLHLILTCLMQTGSVPQIWPEALIIASNSHGEYKSPVFAPYGEESIENEAYQTHALLDVLLENECIKDFDQAVCASSQKGAFFSSLLNNQLSSGMASSFPTYQIPGEIIPLNTSTQEPEKVLPSKKEKNAGKSSIQQQPQYHHISSPVSLSSNSSISSTQSSSQNASQSSTQESDSNSSKHMGLIIQQKPVIGVITSPPSLKTLDDLSYMPPMQALHILKLQMKLTSILGSNLPAALIPSKFLDQSLPLIFSFETNLSFLLSCLTTSHSSRYKN